jgi:SynChlorMet cassette protein ScmC
MEQVNLHNVSFLLKNNVEIIFQGDDEVVHVLNDYRKIFSLLPSREVPSERHVITFRHQQGCDRSYNLSRYHFELTETHYTEIIYDFSNKVPDDYACILMVFSMLLGSVAQQYGGGLIHAALGELDGKGFLMSAPGGVGKTTASIRLPAPFISHCDDTTLLVKDSQGLFWAHPFPTWSRFYWGGPGGSWIFGNALPLHSIFYLSQSETDSLSGLNPAEKVSCCAAAFEQASRLLARDILNKEKVNSRTSGGVKPKRKEPDWFAIGHDPGQHDYRVIRMQWFENASALSRQLPADRLNLSLTGKFWDLIRKSL